MAVACAQKQNYREVIPEYFICLPPQFPRPLHLLGLGDVKVNASLKGALEKKRTTPQFHSKTSKRSFSNPLQEAFHTSRSRYFDIATKKSFFLPFHLHDFALKIFFLGGKNFSKWRLKQLLFLRMFLLIKAWVK